MALALALGASAVIASAAAAQERESLREEVREEVRDARYDRPRLRLGISGVGGGFVGPFHGAAGGLAVRVGIQINDIVAIYLQGQGLLAEFLPDPRPTTLIGFAFHELMLDLTFLDTFQIGAGPSVDFIWGCTAENGGATCGRGGAFFGGDFRLAVLFGGRRPGRRHGLVLSIDAHPTWVDRDFATMLLFGIGGELY